MATNLTIMAINIGLFSLTLILYLRLRVGTRRLRRLITPADEIQIILHLEPGAEDYLDLDLESEHASDLRKNANWN